MSLKCGIRALWTMVSGQLWDQTLLDLNWCPSLRNAVPQFPPHTLKSVYDLKGLNELMYVEHLHNFKGA
jgi:hypothetical protein